MAVVAVVVTDFALIVCLAAAAAVITFSVGVARETIWKDRPWKSGGGNGL
jgi:hypothetical protein